MTNVQLYFAIGVPLVYNTLLFGILIAYINAKFEAQTQALLRVEQVMDARLKHLEERAH